jgi:hypothetical protein
MSSAGTPYEISASYALSLSRAVKALNWESALLPNISALAREAMAKPTSRPWWPGSVNDELIEGTERLFGRDAVVRFALRSVEVGVGPIAMPVLRIAMALSGSSPESIFKRADAVAGIGLRGVSYQWKSESNRSGTLVVQYLGVVSPSLLIAWKGIMQFVFELTKVNGEAKPAFGTDRSAVHIPVKWTPR